MLFNGRFIQFIETIKISLHFNNMKINTSKRNNIKIRPNATIWSTEEDASLAYRRSFDNNDLLVGHNGRSYNVVDAICASK